MARKMKRCSAVAWFTCACVAIATPVQATAQATETVLHSFDPRPKGANPGYALLRDAAGNLYGTASGGRRGAGVVYKLNARGSETVLHAFTGGADGGDPVAGVIGDSEGNLYGTTGGGGTANAGVVFKVDATTRQETVLYSFTGGADGNYPFGGVVRDAAGNLYGTTLYGGSAKYGVVYKVNPAGQDTVLYSFTGTADGSYPQGNLALDSAGNLYGTTTYGVFKLDPAGSLNVLYTFVFSGLGGGNLQGVIRDSAGNLYGTIASGGSANAGEVFKVDSSGQETDLYQFTGSLDGYLPNASLILDAAGNLYGTTRYGGSPGAGKGGPVGLAARGETPLPV
jgi:uncharacterized repeat protein (TIGR03803 family)